VDGDAFDAKLEHYISTTTLQISMSIGRKDSYLYRYVMPVQQGLMVPVVAAGCVGWCAKEGVDLP
jgi:hypothetical protein